MFGHEHHDRSELYLNRLYHPDRLGLCSVSRCNAVQNADAIAQEDPSGLAFILRFCVRPLTILHSTDVANASLSTSASISTMIRAPYIEHYHNPTDNLLCESSRRTISVAMSLHLSRLYRLHCSPIQYRNRHRLHSELNPYLRTLSPSQPTQGQLSLNAEWTQRSRHIWQRTDQRPTEFQSSSLPQSYRHRYHICYGARPRRWRLEQTA